MNLLLDTHIALWAVTDDSRLTEKARHLLLGPANYSWVSAASIWEISIKSSLGRSNLKLSGRAALEAFNEANFKLLPVRPEHAVGVEDLPHYHEDPFDRIIVAQALNEPLRLVTHDKWVARYSDSIIFV